MAHLAMHSISMCCPMLLWKGKLLPQVWCRVLPRSVAENLKISSGARWVFFDTGFGLQMPS